MKQRYRFANNGKMFLYINVAVMICLYSFIYFSS
nr:MAG TPA: hypothetical protein [Caudoviricetes sp.]